MNFSTKYNYVVIVPRFLYIIFFVLLLFVFLSKIPLFLNTSKSLSKFILVVVGAFFITAYFIYTFGKLLINQRKNIIIRNEQLLLKDAITRKEIIINDGIKGFSTSDYPIKVKTLQSIILYFDDGSKIEFPQFLYWNFREIKPTLVRIGMNYLGHEPYKLKWYIKRLYLFG